MQKQIVLGTMLGDAWIRFAAMDHCAAQLPYLRWKLECLKPFASGKIQPLRNNTEYHGQTFSHPEFTELRNLFYGNGSKKIFSPEILTKLGPLSVAVWYMDDGSYKKRDGRVTIATCSIGMENTKMVAEWFTSQGMEAACHKNGVKQHWVVGFKKASSPIFLDWIRPYIHESMSYKLGESQ